MKPLRKRRRGLRNGKFSFVVSSRGGLGGSVRRGARSPDDRDNPGQRGENQVHDRSHHENLERAMPITEVAIDEAETR